MLRLFRAHPGYVGVSTCVLAVSIGMNVLVYTIVNGLWVRPLPFPEPERVVTLPNVPVGRLDSPIFRVFHGGVAGQALTSGDFGVSRPEVEIPEGGTVVEAIAATVDYFRLLRLPVRGRDFVDSDDQDGAEPVAIISDRLWSGAFGRRADVIGAVIPARPIPLRIVGVAPPNFHGAFRGELADLWVPLGLMQRLAPGQSSTSSPPITILARLGPGQSIAAVDQQLDALAPDLRRAYQTSVTPLDAVFGTSGSLTLVSRERNAVLVVSGLAVLLLLGGCATLAALVLMHYERRRTEFGVKMSLGADRGRIARDLVRELSSVAITGSLAAMSVALLGLRLVKAFEVADGVNMARLNLSVDWRVWAVCVAATVISLAAAAALPLARSTRLRLAGELLGGSTMPLGSMRARQTLLALQACVTVVVLVAAVLLVSTVSRAFSAAPGFDVDRTAFVSIEEEGPPPRGAAIPAAVAERSARLMPMLHALPGVAEVAEGIPPIGLDALRFSPMPRTVVADERELQLWAVVLPGSPNLLSALGVPILMGRPLSTEDASAVPHPVVITQSLAERLWPGRRPLGKTLNLPQVRSGAYLVVGVARDFTFGSLTGPKRAVVVTVGHGLSGRMSQFVVRTDQPEITAGLVRQHVKGRDVQVSTGREVVARDIPRQRLGAAFFSGFGLIGLLVGMVGAFGLVSYLAESERRELGVRLALGATMWDLVRHGVAATLVPIAIGLAVGLLVAAVVANLFTSFLVGIDALDIQAYGLVAVVVLSCAGSAALLASWRFRRMTAADALRA